MSIAADALLKSALKLPREDRARMAAELIASLGDLPDEGVEAAWNDELERRIEQVDRGEVQLLDWNAVKGDISNALKRHRAPSPRAHDD